MLLVIDAGNTNIVCALYEGMTQKALARLETEAVQDSEDMDLPFACAGVTGAAIVSVVPRLDPLLTRFCAEKTGHDPLFATWETIPIPVRVESPEKVGTDRILNAWAAREEGGPLPLVVVDAGTAATFDVVDADGAFAGGAIMPGAGLSLGALQAKAGNKLPVVTIARPAGAIGKNTHDAMQAGVFWGHVGAIERILSEITAALGVPPRVVMTGGLAEVFAPALPGVETADKDLTLRGLVRLYGGMEEYESTFL